MATSDAAMTGLQQEIPAVSQPPATTTAKTAVPATKTKGTATVLTDERGSYKIIRVKKPDGSIARVKQRLPSTTEGATKSTSAPATQPPVEASAAKAPVTNSEAATSPPKTENASPAAPVASDAKPALQGADKPASRQTVKGASKIAPANLSSPTSVVKSGNEKPKGRLLRGFSGNVLAQTAVALIPDWDVRDFEADDVPIDSDDNSDDDEFSDDSDDERDRNPNKGSGSDTLDNKSGETSNDNEMPAAAAVARTGGVTSMDNLGRKYTPQVPVTTSLQKDKPVKPVEHNGKPPPYASEKSAKASAKASTTEISEKQINIESLATEKPQQTREPQRVSKTSIFVRLIVWFILIGFPIMFIVLGVLTELVLKGRKTTDHKAVEMKRSITMAITTWPIVFAAVVAQSLKTLATWKVERGIKLMRLEQLLGSHSVASAVKQPFFLRRIDLVSIGLVLLWSLSPIASQAMQRMTYPAASNTTTSTFVAYYVDTTGKNIGLAPNSTHQDVYFQAISIMYAAALLPQDLVNPETDNFNNLIVPILKDLKSTQQDGWTFVQTADDTHSAVSSDGYSTLFGIPVENFLPNVSNGSQEFDISSSYFDVDCSEPVAKTWPDILDMNLNLTAAASGTLFLRWEGTHAADPKNLSFVSVRPADDSVTASTQCYNTIEGYSPIQGCPNSTLTYSFCTFDRVFVDSSIHCDGVLGNTPCFVTKMRPTPSPPDFQNDFSDANSTVDISILLTTTEPSYVYGRPTIMEKWINNPNSAIETLDSTPIDLSSITAEDFTQRFGLLINTFWQVGYSPIHVAGHLTHSDTPDPTEHTVTATANYIDTDDIYVIRQGWLAALFVCSCILLVTGIISAIFETLTVGPDVLGFASSIVRQSKHVRITETARGGSAVSGVERARKLGDVRVMMQDVRGDREVGRIALGTINENTQRLRPGRLYR